MRPESRPRTGKTTRKVAVLAILFVFLLAGAVTTYTATAPAAAQPLLSQVVQAGQGSQTAEEQRIITRVLARETADQIELVIKGTKLLTYQLHQDPEAQNLVFEFPDAILPQDFAAPAITSETIRQVEVREDKPARKVMVVVALAQPAIHRVYLSSDAKEVLIQFTKAPSQTTTSISTSGQILPSNTQESTISNAVSSSENPATTSKTTVSPASASSTFRVFPLVYADPEAVAGILKRLIPYGENKVQVEKGRHAIVVADLSDEALAGVEQFLTEVDKPLPQVFIDAQILEINSDAASNLGLGLSNALLTTATEQSESFGQVPMEIQPFVRSPI